MRESNRRRSAEASARMRGRPRAIRLAWLVPLALGLTLAGSASAEAQKKRLSMNVKIGANTLHTPVYGSLEVRRERRGDVTDLLGWVDMPPQRQFKVGGRCKFSRGGISVQRLEPNALTLPAGFLNQNSPVAESRSSVVESRLRRGVFAAGVLHSPDRSEGGEVKAETYIRHHLRSPRKASLHTHGEAYADVPEGPARSSRADFTGGFGSGAGPHARQPEARQVLVEVINRGSKPVYLRLQGRVSGGISELFRFTTNASARIGYMRLRCGTAYRGGKAKVLVEGGAPNDGGRVSDSFSHRKAQQLRIGRGRHQLWLETMARGGAVGVNVPESEVLHASSSGATAMLDVCLLNRRGGRC